MSNLVSDETREESFRILRIINRVLEEMLSGEREQASLETDIRMRDLPGEPQNNHQSG